MSRAIQRQLYMRKRLVKALLIREMRLSGYYQKELATTATALSPEQVAYKQRVVSAVKQVLHYAKNESDAAVKTRFIRIALMRWDNDVLAVCNELNISERTYHNWRNKFLTLFGRLSGIGF